MYNDDSMYYANFTAHNIEMYQTIGRNLEKGLLETLDCYLGPKTNNEYSTYVEKNCKLFQDGVCQGAKNATRFNTWIAGFHSGYADAYCNKKQDRKKCIRYNGARANDKMVLPLLEELRDYLQADSDEYIVVNTRGSHANLTPDYSAIPFEMKSVAKFFGKEVLLEVSYDDFIANIVSCFYEIAQGMAGIANGVPVGL